MSTESRTAANGSAAAPAATPERRKPALDQRYVAPIFVSCVLAVASLGVGILESPWKTLAAIVTAMVTEAILGLIFYKKIPNLASAYVSGISVGILVRSPYYWPFLMCAAISIASKYVFRVNDRHIWNPSNFGIAAMILVAHDYMSTLSIQFGNSLGPMFTIWCLGAVIIYRLKRFHICATYVASFFVLGYLRSLITGNTYWESIAPITGPMYQLFTFFMITDPRTTVTTRKGQILVAFLVALVEAGLRLAQNVHAPYFALFTVGPIANLVEAALKRKKKAG
jgi:Na+-transporting NADH:ubiquinone oxidoreductase subunit NqrB